jgi:hypothetical protein
MVSQPQRVPSAAKGAGIVSLKRGGNNSLGVALAHGEGFSRETPLSSVSDLLPFGVNSESAILQINFAAKNERYGN